jgi:translocation and assembly module TamB
MTSAKPGGSRRRRLRLLLIVGAALVVVPLVLAAALPWWLGTPPARRWLLARANRALQPARLEFRSIRFSWFGPTRLSGFVLRDAEGEPVVKAPAATWDRTLGQILIDRPRLGTLTLAGAALDIERRADGTVDLYEAIRPVLGRDPRTDLHIRVPDGRLRLRVAGQPVPVTAEKADLRLDLPAAPSDLMWRLRLENGAGPQAQALELRGEYQRWGGKGRPSGDLAVDIQGKSWPWAVSLRGVDAAGRLDGALAVARQSGRWSVSGRTDMTHVEAAGALLAGDRLRLDRIAGTWDLAQTPTGWAVRRLDLTSPLGTLKAVGALPASTPDGARLEGTLDLAAVAAQLPHLLRIREGVVLERGGAHVRVEGKTEAGKETWDLSARISDLHARNRDRSFTLRDPATLGARLASTRQRLAVEELSVETPFLKLKGREMPADVLAWDGSIDLAGLRRQLGDIVDFGTVDLAGQGTLAGRYARSRGVFQGDLQATLHDLRINGVAGRTLRRDEAALTIALSGPTDHLGLPRGWEALRVELKSGTTSADLATSRANGPRQLSAHFRSPLPTPLGGVEHEARGRLEVRWDEAGVAVKSAELTLAPTEDRPGAETIVLFAEGRYDRASGELVLTPDHARGGSSVVTLAPEGIHVSGLGSAGRLRASAAFTGEVQRLARLLSGTSAGLKGTWSARGEALDTPDGLKFAGRIDLPDLSSGPSSADAPRRAEGPVSLALNATYAGKTDQLDVSELALVSPYATLEGAGRVRGLGGEPEVDLRGRLAPDWEAINRMLADRVEPGARLSGKPRDWRIQGKVAADSTANDQNGGGLDGEFGFDLVDLDIYGLHVGPTPVVLRAQGGKLALDPIDTSLNGGRIHLEPELVRDEKRGTLVRLGPSSSIAGAEINDEVSRRFLSYVAPVLDRATRAHGRVSVSLQEAVFPLGGTENKGTSVTGSVVFQEVEFLPGPFMDQLLDLVGREERPGLKLDAPVALTIADRRVYQRGFALPLGRLTRIELSGWVDFDRNVELTASLPITPAMVGNNPVLSEIVAGQRISVPIRGTLQKPQIDREAMNLALRDLGKSLLGNGAIRGAAELLMRLGRGRDPNAPPPMTLQERRARRRERQAERRRDRGSGP